MLYLNLTNDPYVDSDFPRCYDNFTFDFPDVKLDPDGRTFSYRTPEGRAIPVAIRKSGFLGIEEIRLLPANELLIDKPHGYLTLTLQITG